MADPSSPPSGTNHSASFLAPGSILMFLALVASAARIYSRLYPKRLMSWDDYVLLATIAITIAWFATDITLYAHGRGIDGVMPEMSVDGPLMVASGILWIWALNLIKISMCFMLLRLKDSKRWQWSLWVLIALQASLIIAASSVQLAYCQPLSAAWSPTPDAICIPMDKMMIYGYTYGVFGIATDVIISLMPLAFIFKMHRSKTEKVLVACLMAAGLAASACAIVRLMRLMGALKQYSIAWLDVERDMIMGFELLLAIIAANLPPLKGPTHRLLIRLGLLSASRPTGDSPTSALGHMTHGSQVARQINDLAHWDDGEVADASSETTVSGTKEASGRSDKGSASSTEEMGRQRSKESV